MKRSIHTILAIAVIFVMAIGVIAASDASPTGAAPIVALPWLKTLNGQIVRSDTNQRVELRGVNVLRNEWVYPDMSYERLAIPHLASVWRANLITHGFASAPVVANDATYLGVLDEYQRLAEQNNMYIIFAYYYPTLNGEQPERPNDDPSSTQALVNLVQRYRTKSNVLFMLQAEPHSGVHRVTWNSLRPTYDQMITAMRAVDNPAPQKHLILASGDGWGRDISPVVTNGEVGHPDPITADGHQNIVYSSHPYDRQASSNNWEYFRVVADAGYPVLVTEFGTGGQMDQSDTLALMDMMNNGTRHVSWTAWIFDNEGCPCLLTGTRTNFTPSSPYGISVRDRVFAEATNFNGSGGPTSTPTRTNTPAPTSTPGARVLVGHVTWQGRPAQPHARQQLPVTLTLKLGMNEVNYPVQTTDASGFFTVSVGSLANGTYDWRVKGPKFLANSGSVILAGASRTSFEGSLLLTGDCDNNNVVSTPDFIIVRNSMARTVGEPGYDDRADLSGDGIVNGVDFALIQAHIGTGGAPPTGP
jgi:hypothetical protein